MRTPTTSASGYSAPPNHRRKGIGVAMLTALLVGSACSSSGPELAGYEVDPAPAVGAFTLTDGSDGDAPFPLRAAPGEVLVAFLGFTNCPDECPTAMAKISTALDELGDRADRIEVAMITVDPVRDTSAVLTQFAQGFVDGARALRTDDEQLLQSVTTAFGATAASEHDHEGMTTQVGHTDYIYVLDQDGTVVLTWTADRTADEIADDLKVMLDRASPQT